MSSTPVLDREAHKIKHIEHLIGAAATLTAKKDAGHFLSMLVGPVTEVPVASALVRVQVPYSRR